MGVFKGFVGIVFKPIGSTYQSIDGARGRIGRQLEQLRESRRLARERYDQEKKIAKFDGHIDDVDLLEMPAAAIGDDELRFRALYLQNGWNEDQLQKRLRSIIWRKRLSGVICLASFLFGLVVIGMAPVWVMLVLTPGLLLCSAVFAGLFFLDGVYQAQIEERRLMSGREYLSRDDLFAHLVS